MKSLRSIFAVLALMLVYAGANAQMNRKSPHTSVKGTVNGANITITYGSPAVKGRTILGGLVPYEKTWRSGADEATIFETDKDLMVEGKKLPAGKYSLFYTPSSAGWAVIFNSQTGQWGIKRTGEADFDPAKNVITVKVKGQKTAMTENLAYVISPNSFELKWDTFSVPVKLK